MGLRLLLPIFASLTLISACGPMRQSGATTSEPAILEVDNRGFPDMAVYVLNGGQRVRLGLATGNTKTDLKIPPYVLTGARQLKFLADPIGGSRTSVSNEIYVAPGDRVTLVIPP